MHLPQNKELLSFILNVFIYCSNTASIHKWQTVEFGLNCTFCADRCTSRAVCHDGAARWTFVVDAACVLPLPRVYRFWFLFAHESHVFCGTVSHVHINKCAHTQYTQTQNCPLGAACANIQIARAAASQHMYKYIRNIYRHRGARGLC